MTDYAPVAGTWEREKDRQGDHPNAWFRRGSAFDQEASSCALVRVEQDADDGRGDPGYWSGDLDGMLWQFGKAQQIWVDGGNNLAWFIERRASKLLLVIIAHSHGGQVAAYGLAGLDPRIRRNIRLITVDMPVRRDMYTVYLKAKSRLRRWVHLYSNRFNKMRMLGSRFGPMKLACADANIHIAGGHSAVLRDPAHFGGWRDAIGEAMA